MTKATQTTDQAETQPENAPVSFKIKRVITVPLLKPQLDIPFYIKVTGEVFVGKEIQSEKTKDMEAANLVNCINLATGEAMQLIVPAVLSGIFEDEYTGGKYVGLGFMITKHPKASGKRYHPFSVAELEL
jgi:hypothetical protein